MTYYEEGDSLGVFLIRLDFRVHEPQWRVLILAALSSEVLLGGAKRTQGKFLSSWDVAYGVKHPEDYRTWLHFDGLTVPFSHANDARRHVVRILNSYPWNPLLEERLGIADPFRGERGAFQVINADAFRQALGAPSAPVEMTHSPGTTTLHINQISIVLHRAPVPRGTGEVTLDDDALAMLTYTRDEQSWVIATMYA